MAKKGFEGFDPTKRTTHSAAAEEARQVAAEEAIVRLNLEVPERVRKALQMWAVEEGTTVKALALPIIEKALKGEGRL